MFNSLPQDVQALLTWSWEEIEPHYRDLAARSPTAANVAEWLADWTALDERVNEMYSRLHLATTQNTADKEAEERFRSFLDHIHLPVEAEEQKLREKLLSSGLEPNGFQVPLRKMRAEAHLFREANLPLLAKERKLALQYDQIIGAQMVEWQGQEVTISQLRPAYQDADRSKRERAWRLGIRRQLADREAIDELWAKFLELRGQLAANAGKRDYRQYRWQQLHRFDYTPADCRHFQKAIEQAVVPAAERLYEKRRQRLGVDRLRPWDVDVDPFGRPPLRPFRDGEELKAIAARIFDQVDPQVGKYFQIMVQESLLDLNNRKNKAPGGYCTSFPMSRRPFIFMNAVGVHDDLQTCLHESGHAFHNFERDALPYSQQRYVGMEFAEVASMGMELLASPYLAAKSGGAYSEPDAARARIEHLESNILFWPYMAVVDAFQHWVYENPRAAANPSNCDEEWAKLWRRFMKGEDWSGLEEEMKTGWHRKLHIHQVPFYYIEYGLAQLGAMQLWRNALSNQSAAVARYRRALAMGGTASLPELYAAAGCKFAFDADTLGSMVALAEKVIGELEEQSRGN
jgi:oligoendopeptidase F